MHIDHIQNVDYNTHLLYSSPGPFEFITNFKLKYEFGSIKKAIQNFEFDIVKSYPEKFDDIFYFKR